MVGQSRYCSSHLCHLFSFKAPPSLTEPRLLYTTFWAPEVVCKEHAQNAGKTTPLLYTTPGAQKVVYKERAQNAGETTPLLYTTPNESLLKVGPWGRGSEGWVGLPQFTPNSPPIAPVRPRPFLSIGNVQQKWVQEVLVYRIGLPISIIIIINSIIIISSSSSSIIILRTTRTPTRRA